MKDSTLITSFASLVMFGAGLAVGWLLWGQGGTVTPETPADANATDGESASAVLRAQGDGSVPRVTDGGATSAEGRSDEASPIPTGHPSTLSTDEEQDEAR